MTPTSIHSHRSASQWNQPAHRARRVRHPVPVSPAVLPARPLYYDDIVEDIAPESLTALAALRKFPEHIQGAPINMDWVF